MTWNLLHCFWMCEAIKWTFKQRSACSMWRGCFSFLIWAKMNKAPLVHNVPSLKKKDFTSTLILNFFAFWTIVCLVSYLLESLMSPHKSCLSYGNSCRQRQQLVDCVLVRKYVVTIVLILFYDYAFYIPTSYLSWWCWNVFWNQKTWTFWRHQSERSNYISFLASSRSQEAV